MRLFTAEQSRKLDRKTIDEHGVASLLLMENAAVALCCKAEELAVNKTAAVFCGSGNNGGDGIAAARILCGHGYTVRAFLAGNRDKLSEDCSAMEKRLSECGLKLEDFSMTQEILSFAENAGVIIDAMLGTGLNSPIRGKYAEAIELINSLNVPVVSADIPSGISSDTGAVLGSCVRAAATVTFGYPKIGHFIEPGCVYVGKLTVADIGIRPDEEIFNECMTEAYLAGDAARDIPERPQLSHKGTFGRLLVLGGSIGYTGAPYLAAQAAVRSGTGLVFLGVPDEIYPIEAVKCIEAMPYPLGSDKGIIDGRSEKTIEWVSEKLKSCSACLAGPGLGRGAGAEALIRFLIENFAVPVILDADGINAVAAQPELLKMAKAPLVLTPHEGEFARLGGSIGEDRLSAARSFACDNGCILVLKGHRTITALPNGRCFVNTCGNSGMAKGGSGDVLAGMIAALCCRIQPEKAVRLAVYLHSRAGDIAAESLTEESMTPGDIIAYLPEAFAELKQKQ